MRVAYVISTLEKCGPVNVLYDTVNNLGPDFECAVFTLATEPENTRIEDFKRAGVRVECAVESRFRSMVSGTGLLEKSLDAWKPDIVHAHGYRATIISKDIMYPHVVTVHNCIFEDFKNTYPLFQARLMERSEVSALRQFDAVIACSESNAAFLRDQYGLDCLAIRNGVDKSLFCPATPSERKEIRSRLNLPVGKLLIVSTGICCERKASLQFAEAFAQALGQEKNVELHVLGGGPLLEQCRLASSTNSYFHGPVDNVPDWLKACDIYFSAARSEGMPLAVLEAASSGLPLVLSDIPPHREIATALSGQQCVRLFRKDDSLELRNVFKEMTGCQPALLPPYDVSMLSSANMAQSYARLYQRIIGNRIRPLIR